MAKQKTQKIPEVHIEIDIDITKIKRPSELKTKIMELVLEHVANSDADVEVKINERKNKPKN